MTSLKEKMEKIRKHNKKSANKAISPVIASIILIAITIAIAVAIGGFVFGLFGSFTQSGGVQVINPTLDTVDNTFRASVTNTKDTSVTIAAITANGNGGALCTGVLPIADPGPPPEFALFSGKTGPLLFSSVIETPGACVVGTGFTAGTSYTVRVSFSDGTQVAAVVTAS